MNTHFKSALGQIKAEDELVNKTELYLRDALSNNSTPKVIAFKKSSVRKAIVAAASFFILIIGGAGGAYAYYQTPTAYLCLDINPSVELGVNAFGTVVKAEGYNEDGQSVLNGTDVTGNSVENAVQNLILSANDKGFIADDGSTVISLTSETNNTDKATTLQTNSESGVNEALDAINRQAVIQKDNVALDRRNEAKELGITPGKLNLINKLQTIDPNATIEDYKNASVKDIMKAIKDNNGNGVPVPDNKTIEVNGNNSDNSSNNNSIDSTTIETKSINDNKSDNAPNEVPDNSNTDQNASGTTTDKKTDSNSVDSNSVTDKGSSDNGNNDNSINSDNNKSDSNSNIIDSNNSDNNSEKGNSFYKSNSSGTDLKSDNSKK